MTRDAHGRASIVNPHIQGHSHNSLVSPMNHYKRIPGHRREWSIDLQVGTIEN